MENNKMKMKYLIALTALTFKIYCLFGQLNIVQPIHLKDTIVSLRVTTYNAKLQDGQVVQDGIGFDKEEDGSSITDYIFNKGKLRTEREYSKDSILQIVTDYEYGNNEMIIMRGHDVLKSVLDAKGHVMKRIDENYGQISYYKYDPNGNLIEEKSFGKNQKSPFEAVYNKYDLHNNLIEQKIFDEGKPAFRYAMQKFKYDPHHNMVEAIAYFPNNKLAYRDTYQYDMHGNKIKRTRYFSLDNTQLYGQETYKYEFDSIGNWVKQTKYWNAQPRFIIERQIKYTSDLEKERNVIVKKLSLEQSSENENENKSDNGRFVSVQQEATFPGGIKAWTTYLNDNLHKNVATDNNAPPGQYVVIVSFLINKDGSISDVKANAPYSDYGTKAEAERVIKASPKWNPAIHDGKAVAWQQKQRITFTVDGGY